MANIHLRKDSLGVVSSSTHPTLSTSRINRKPVPDRSIKDQGKRSRKEATIAHPEPLPHNPSSHQNHPQDVDEVLDLYASNHHRSRSLPPITPVPQELVVLPTPKPTKKRKSRRTASEPSSTFDRTSWDITMSRPTSLLIASLGNPPPYHSTRHSAAHVILKSLQTSLSLPPFTTKSKPYGGGHVSVGTEFTLYQSAVQMNVSGPPLLKAWKQFAQLADVQNRNVGLVVLHDEMEASPGQFKIKRGNGSAKGHNGIKSVQGSLQGAGLLGPLGERFVKIGVGIGRPASGSRESRDVSAYVLGQLTRAERDGLEEGVAMCERILWQEVARIGQAG